MSLMDKLRMEDSNCLLCGHTMKFYELSNHYRTCHRAEIQIIITCVFATLMIITSAIVVSFLGGK